jgi:hypothetical protein
MDSSAATVRVAQWVGDPASKSPTTKGKCQRLPFWNDFFARELIADDVAQNHLQPSRHHATGPISRARLYRRCTHRLHHEPAGSGIGHRFNGFR